MTLPTMLHIAAHFAVPTIVALTFYRERWVQVALILIACPTSRFRWPISRMARRRTRGVVRRPEGVTR